MRRALVHLTLQCLVLGVAPAGAAPPRAPDQGCRWSTLAPLDTTVSVARNEWARHLGSFEPAATRVYEKGPVAVIEGDRLLVPPPNLFDLEGRSLRFEPSGNGYFVAESSADFETPVGERLALSDDDAVRLNIPGWRFPFYGDSWSRLYVNSNGSLTFGRADERSYADLRSFHLGPPRIAVFQADLDPGVTSGESGIFARSTPD